MREYQQDYLCGCGRTIRIGMQSGGAFSPDEYQHSGKDERHVPLPGSVVAVWEQHGQQWIQLTR
jgi:hypothetical protein